MTGLPKGYCVRPWVTMHASTAGDIAPCCEFDGSVANLKDRSLSEVWTSEEWAEIRRKFATGEKVAECWKCYDRERNEGSSARLTANKRHADWCNTFAKAEDLLAAPPKHPITYDLRPSNLCNLSCRTCWHGASSSWFKDGVEIGLTAGPKAEIRSYKSGQQILDDIGPGLGHVEELYFAGGEPLMMEEHYALLSALAKKGRSDIVLKYNSNLTRTKFRGESIFDLWTKFDHVEVEVSVDAAYDRGALVRHGFNWDQFVDNLAELRSACPHVAIGFGITVSALNILYLAELFDALIKCCRAKPSDFGLHSLQSPIFYRTQVLPPEIKTEANSRLRRWINENSAVYTNEADGFIALQNKLENICNYMDADDLSEHTIQLAERSKKLDALRNQNTLATLPDLAPVFTTPVSTSALGFLRSRFAAFAKKRS